MGFVGGQAHVPAVKKIEGAELIAVIDAKEELAKNVAAKYDVKYYTDFSARLKLGCDRRRCSQISCSTFKRVRSASVFVDPRRKRVHSKGRRVPCK